MLKLFVLEGKNVVLNKPEIATIKVFKNILRRDRGSKGDAQGREKLMAYAEFAYIYHMCDLGSIPNTEGYNEDKAHEWAVKQADLLELNPDWVVDAGLEDAMNEYKELQQDIPSLNILKSLKEGLNSSSSLIRVMVDKMNKYVIELTELSLVGDDDEVIEDPNNPESFLPNPNSASKKLEKAIKLQSQVLGLAKDLPKTMEQVKVLAEQVKKELEQSHDIRGGRKLNNREDPR